MRTAPRPSYGPASGRALTAPRGAGGFVCGAGRPRQATAARIRSAGTRLCGAGRRAEEEWPEAVFLPAPPAGDGAAPRVPGSPSALRRPPRPFVPLPPALPCPVRGDAAPPVPAPPPADALRALPSRSASRLSPGGPRALLRRPPPARAQPLFDAAMAPRGPAACSGPARPRKR